MKMMETGAGGGSKGAQQEFFLMGKEEAVSAIERWLAQAFEPRSGSILPRREVYETYLAWCTEHNAEATAQSAFGKILHRVFPALQSRRMGGKGRHVMCYQDFAHKNRPSSSPSLSASPSPSSRASTKSSSPPVVRSSTPTPSSPNISSSSAYTTNIPTISLPPGGSYGDLFPATAAAMTNYNNLHHSAPTPLPARPASWGPRLRPSPPRAFTPPHVPRFAAELHNSAPAAFSSAPSLPDSTLCPDPTDSPWKWLHSTDASYRSRKRGRAAPQPPAQPSATAVGKQRQELARRISQRRAKAGGSPNSGTGNSSGDEQRAGSGGDEPEDDEPEMEEEKEEEGEEAHEQQDEDEQEVDEEEPQRVVKPEHGLRQDVPAEARRQVKQEQEQHAQLRVWLEKEIEDDIRLLRQDDDHYYLHQQQQHHQQQQWHKPNNNGQTPADGHHLLQDTFGFAAVPAHQADSLFAASGAKRNNNDLASHPLPAPLLLPDRAFVLEGTAAGGTGGIGTSGNGGNNNDDNSNGNTPVGGGVWYRSEHSFPTLSFPDAYQHPWVVCPFFTCLAFLRRAMSGDTQIFPLAEHFSQLTESFLAGCLPDAVGQLIHAREQISRVFDTTRAEVAWALLCLTWWNRLLFTDDDSQSRCAYYVALARQMCVQLRLPPAHDIAVSAYLSGLLPTSLQPGSSAGSGTSAAAVSSSPMPLSPLALSPSLGGFSLLSPAGRSSSSLATSPRPMQQSSPPLLDTNEFVNRIARDLYASKIMSEHPDQSQAYCKVETDLLQCFIISFDLILLHLRGPASGVGHASSALMTYLLSLSPPVLAIFIFELSLKERVLETLLSLLPQCVEGQLLTALYRQLSIMQSVLPVARAMDLLRLASGGR